MTAALNSNAAAMPNPLAGLTGRVKKLDPNELVAVANEVATQQQQFATALGEVPTGTFTPIDGAAQQQAQADDTPTGTFTPYAQATPTTATTPSTQTTVPTAAAPTTATTPTTEAAPTTQTTATQGASGSGAVAIPSSQVAPRTEHDYWTKHIAQFSGKYLPDGPTMRPNCGPASVTMALRMIGLDIPGFSGQNSEAVLDQARILATGKNDYSVGTTDSELETLVNKSGGQWSESNNFDEVTGWVKQGIPVVLSGNPAYGWNSRYSNDDVQHFNGGHWVTVSGYDQSTGYYIVNDPLSQIGPIYVSEAELKGYNQAHGNLGIAVFR